MNSEILDKIGLGDVDIFYLFLTLAIIILVLLIIVIVQTVTTLKLKKRLRIFMSGRNAMSLENGIASIYRDISMLKEHDIRFRSDIKDIKVNLLDCYQKVGLVKYDAFREMGGQLSFSIAMLDKQDNGFILNSVHSANGCYTYTKEIQNGVSAIELADEEKEALSRAMRVTTGSTYEQPKTDLNGQAYDRQTPVYQDKQPIFDNETPVYQNEQPIYDRETPAYRNGQPAYGYNDEDRYYGPDNGYDDMEQEYYDNGSSMMTGRDTRYNA